VDDSQLTLAMITDRARREFACREVVTQLDGGTVTHTYEQLFKRVDRLAWALRSLGVRKGDRVGTLSWNHHRHLEVYLATVLSGAVLHTINLRLSGKQIVAIARHAGDRVLFIDADLCDLIPVIRAELPELQAIVTIGDAEGRTADTEIHDYEALLAAQPAEGYGYPALTEQMPAATCYSSATTGVPKGVVYSHRALLLHSMMLGLRDTWGLGEADTVMPIVPMFHVNAWGLPFTALWMGARLVLPGARPTPGDILTLLSEQRVTLAAAVPTVWMDVLALLREQDRRLPDLRLVVSGGAPLPRSLLERADALQVPMIHSYGMTEASPLVLVGQPRSVVLDSGDPMDRRLRQGYVVPGLDYRIVDVNGGDVPRDGKSAGELLLRGPWVAEEYERDKRSATAFTDGWYHTGDIVSIDADGYLQVVDRAADVIKSGGEWISSVELENALMDHESVSSAAVVGVPDDRWQERPCAYVVASGPVSADDLRAFLAERFPRFWVPDRVVFVDRIPLTSVGKFDKRALRATPPPAEGLRDGRNPVRRGAPGPDLP
jgi:fatty-acyl-CoA synthase